MSPKPAEAATARGAIRDQGYVPYRGDYAPERSRALVVARYMLALAARRPWVKVMLVLAIFPTLVSGVVMYIKAKMGAMTGASSGDGIIYQLYVAGYGTLPLAFLTALSAGGGAVADDVAAGAFPFYFARPVSQRAYLVGKLVPPLLLIAAVSLVPATVLSIVRVALAREGAEAEAALLLPVKVLGFGVLEALLLGVPQVALSSLARSRGYAQGAFAGLFVVPWILGNVFAKLTRSPWPLSLSIPAALDSLGRLFFSVPTKPDERVLPVWAALCLVAALVGGAALILARRVRALEVWE